MDYLYHLDKETVFDKLNYLNKLKMWSNDHIFFVYKLALYKFGKAKLTDLVLIKIEGMKILILLLNLLFLVTQSFAQDCYKEGSQENLKLNYCQVWLDRTFQGTIEDDNQRIEIRFLEISQNPDISSQYMVEGKSRVHDNVCDFKGVMTIEKIMHLDEPNGDCESDLSEGIIYGTYEFNENPNQNHVGIFKGQFKTMFDRKKNLFVINQSVFGQEDFNSFVGIWMAYNKSEKKYCAWGSKLAPSKQENLFKHYDNEFYLFNVKYMSKGWKSYVLSKFNSFIKVPKEFDLNMKRSSSDFTEFSGKEIEKAISDEKNEWWK